VEDAFLWRGRTWRSLSVIAREITGTRWSGPRFFGLDKGKVGPTERQPAHGGGRVELPRHGDERHALSIEGIDDLGEVVERARKSIDLVDDDRVDAAALNVGEQALQRRPLHRAARETSVVVPV
jgi:hypothetical protein